MRLATGSLLLTVLSVILAACANENEKGAHRDRSLGPGGDPVNVTGELTGSEVERYVRGLRAARELGVSEDLFKDATLPELASSATNKDLSGDALDVMREQEFKHPRLKEVRRRMLLAWGSLRFEAQREGLLKQRNRDLAAVERLKDRMDPEQYQEMLAKVEGSVREIEKLFRDISDEERELVRAKQAELDKLLQ